MKMNTLISANIHAVTSVFHTKNINYMYQQHGHELIHNHEVIAIMDNMDGIFKLID